MWLDSVVRGVKHPRCGSLADFGNSSLGGGKWYDRYKGVAELVPTAKGISVKAHAFDAKGNETETDFTKMMKIVVDGGYKGRFLEIEYEGDGLSEVEGTRATKTLLERTLAALCDRFHHGQVIARCLRRPAGDGRGRARAVTFVRTLRRAGRQLPIPIGRTELWLRRTGARPGSKYNPSIPTLRSVVGHDSGARITPPESIIAYLKALHAAAPERTRLVEYARTWEGRPLHVLVIGRAERMAQLDAVKQRPAARSPIRARWPAPRSTRLIKRLPVVDLADARRARQRDLLVRRRARRGLSPAGRAGRCRGRPILRESLVLIDPLENPDGRARFVLPEPAGRGRPARRRAGLRRARRALAGRPHRTTTSST